MDDLTLPNPARKLWLETRDIVRKALEQLQPGIEYRIGGGTILAAGWKHRGSFDVDLQVPKGTKLDELQGAAYGWLDTELKRLGAKPGYRARLNLFTITRGEKPDQQEVQVWGHEPQIGGCPAGSRKSAATDTHYPAFCKSARTPSSSSRCAFSIHRCS